MRPIGVEPKAVSTISTNDLGKTAVSSETKSAESGALVALIRQIVNLTESELEKLSKALTNTNPDS